MKPQPRRNPLSEPSPRQVQIAPSPGSAPSRTSARAARAKSVSRYLGETRTGRWFLVRADERDDDVSTVHPVRPEIADASRLETFEGLRSQLTAIDHPSVAVARDLVLDADLRPHFVLDGVDGSTIEDACHDRGSDWRHRVELVARACDAVQVAHDHGVVHHGIETATVFVGGNPGDPDVRVAGFGVVPSLFGETTSVVSGGLAPDTAWIEFVAPEQSVGLPADGRADVYALAVLLHRLLTGTGPHDAATLRRAARMGMLDWTYRDGPLAASDRLRMRGESAEPVAMSCGSDRARLECVLRDRVDAILRRALACDPIERTASPAEFARELRDAARPDRSWRVRVSGAVNGWWR